MKIIITSKTIILLKILLLSTILFGCTQEPELWKLKSEQLVISAYISNNSDQYSEFGKLLESAGLTNLMSVRGPYTLFLPNNEAMKAYYKEKGVQSLEELDGKFKKKLAFNHLIDNAIQTSDIGLGALRDTNAIGDYLVTDFKGSDIIINKQSKIIKRDIQVANGYIHQIDKVIDLVTLSVYDKLASDPSYSIFTEGLKRTGIKDTLQLISFPYGKKSARTRYTILAVPDAVYNRYGINTIDDLINRYTPSPDSITFLKNGFYRYMEYHCMGNTYYFSNFSSGTKLYPVLSSDNNISVTIDTDYKLNYDKSTNLYTSFDIENSDIPAKNGAIHSIRGLLPVTQPKASVIVFETTDYFDLKQGDYYGKYYMKWSYKPGEKSPFAKIRWEGDFLQYYYKNHDTGNLLNWDCLNMNGFWWCEIITPKIMKGNYTLTSNLLTDADYKVYVDGVQTALIKGTDPEKTTSWGDFSWEDTREHKIKVVNTTWGTLFWDTLIFTPIN
ncbi:MAG: fasciclin domain-containing protein [Chloroflexota bacterium]